MPRGNHDDHNERNRKAKEVAGNLWKKADEAMQFFTTAFYDRTMSPQAQSNRRFLFLLCFFLARHCHEMSDKHRGDILTLKMQYPSRWECGETSPAGVLDKRRRRRIIKPSISAHHSILVKTVSCPVSTLTHWNQWILQWNYLQKGHLQMLMT